MANTDVYVRMAMHFEAISRRLSAISSDLLFCQSLSTARNSFSKEISDIAKLQGALAELLALEAPEEACRNSSLHQIRLLSMPPFENISK